MRVLVTGGAGFIGSHLADGFLLKGANVAILDNLSTGRRENVPEKAEFFEADIRDKDSVRAIFGAWKPDVLCHQAAQADVRVSVADPAADAQVNILGSIHLLEACRAAGTRRVLFASTGGAIYGEQDVIPAGETHPLRPVSPYGAAKLAVETYLHYYAVEYGFRWTALRYANVYGPRQNPHGEAGVVAIFTDKLLAGVCPLINGDGEQTRDYVYVGDVVRANLAAMDGALEGPYNVGTGVETTVNEIFDRLNNLTEGKMHRRHGPAKPGEQRRSCLDTRKLTKDAGWRSGTSLDNGLRETVQYFRKKSMECA